MPPLLDVRDLHTEFRTGAGVVPAVDGISYTVERGETVAMMLSNRPEAFIVDTAAMHLGAVPFSVYNTSSPEASSRATKASIRPSAESAKLLTSA